MTNQIKTIKKLGVSRQVLRGKPKVGSNPIYWTCADFLLRELREPLSQRRFGYHQQQHAPSDLHNPV